MTTELRCLRCGRTGHESEDCTRWPTDTEDLPEPPPDLEPDFLGGFIFPKGTT
jgi:hypothetical protein